MKLLKLGGAALNQTPFDWQLNRRNILNAIDEARVNGVTILCLPELCITGYGCEDDFFRADLRRTAWNILLEILPHTLGMVVCLGLPLLHKNRIYNCTAVVVDGKISGFVAKKALANDGLHYESRHFAAWPNNLVEEHECDGASYPIGDVYFRVGDLLIGFEMCEEAWIGKREGAELTGRAVDIILNPSASHFAFSKINTRKRLVLEGSRAFGVAYVYVNMLGNEAGRAIYDGGTLIAQSGKFIAEGRRFSYQDFLLTTGVIDVEQTRMTQSRTGSFKPEITGHKDEKCVVVPTFIIPQRHPEPTEPVVEESWETGGRVKEEEFARCIALGLFDYNRKSRANGFMLSLSGGADSTAVACLIKLMVDFGVAELGLDGFKEKLSHIQGLKKCSNNEQLVHELLVCVYQSTAQSGPVTKAAAKEVAEAIGARYFYVDVEPVVRMIVRTVGKAIGREVTWETDDIPLQNIQARVRSPFVWMMANIFGLVLLSTSNRSEGAVGYCTMDGDTAGGLSPIAGIDKCFLKWWLTWLQVEGPELFKPIPELASVNKQTPTAELRPSSNSQTDEKDLMPYDVLNAIEDDAIENNRSPKECYQLMRVKFPRYEPYQIAQWVERFFHLWSANQWKRERLAPALHCDTRNLDPRTWRRSPILSGRFELEIAHMWEFALKTDIANATEMTDASLLKSRENIDGNGQRITFGKRALVIVDVQHDFMPDGALAVPFGDEVVKPINELIDSGAYAVVVATQDWHPKDHGCFAANHDGLKEGTTFDLFGISQIAWPVHCVQGSRGAGFHPELAVGKVTRVFQKGMDKTVDSYSGFFDNQKKNNTGLAQYLRAKGIDAVDVVGLAFEHCVKATAIDAAENGFKTRILKHASRAIESDQRNLDKVTQELTESGVELVSKMKTEASR